MSFKVFFCILMLIYMIADASEQSELDLLIHSWKKHPDENTLRQLLDALYFPYLTDSNNRNLHSFYDSMRQKREGIEIITRYRKELIAKYTFDEEYSRETAAHWLMPVRDARRLFLLVQVDQDSISTEILHAMFKSIYLDVERCFAFEFAFKDRYGIFPVSEYQRLLEIMIRISGHEDPFLKSLNIYSQALIQFNLGKMGEGERYLSVSNGYLKSALQSAETQLARKIILLRFAQTEQLLGSFESAETAYVEVLRMDPQDWHALSGLGRVLQKTDQCNEANIWIEAKAKSNQQLYDITVHCGSQELPEPKPEDQAPVIAFLRSSPFRPS
jgi:tetratricopeptide (TPR) repeat protein